MHVFDKSECTKKDPSFNWDLCFIHHFSMFQMCQLICEQPPIIHSTGVWYLIGRLFSFLMKYFVLFFSPTPDVLY